MCAAVSLMVCNRAVGPEGKNVTCAVVSDIDCCRGEN